MGAVAPPTSRPAPTPPARSTSSPVSRPAPAAPPTPVLALTPPPVQPGRDIRIDDALIHRFVYIDVVLEDSLV